MEAELEDELVALAGVFAFDEPQPASAVTASRDVATAAALGEQRSM
ncbi:MAG: hypothetical protein ABIQ13_01685 [Pedococcus sp.]